MIVKIYMAALPKNIKEMINKEVEKRFELENSHNENFDTDRNIQSEFKDTIDITIDNANLLQSVKQKLKDILVKHRIRDYVVVSDSQEKDKIIILHRKKAENSGIYHCHHCGMSFDNEIQLTMHHRIHYLI
jgi:hypothetical protein